MKIKEITLKNMLGVREFKLSVDGPVLIEGRNATGKTSILKGLQTIIDGGSLAKIKNDDATDDEPAEGVIVLDGEDGLVRVERNEKGLKVREQVDGSQAYKDVDIAPQRWLNRIYDAPTVNPVAILTADPKKRIDLILNAIVVDHDTSQLWDHMGLKPENFEPIPKGIHPLKEIAKIRTAVFNERTGVNRSSKDNNAAALEIRKTIPAEIPTVEDIKEKDDQLVKLRAAYKDALNAAHNKKERTQYESESWRDRVIERQRHDLAELYDRLKLEMAEKMDSKKEEFLLELSATEKKHLATCDEADSEKDSEIARADGIRTEGEELNAEIAKLRERNDDIIRIDTLSDQADEHESKAREFKSFSTRLTAALDTLDAYKIKLCSSVPIEGLEIEDSGITIDGIKWEHVNTGRQIEAVVDLALLRCKDKALKMIFVDGAEALDSERRELLSDKIDAAGAQPFFSCVSDCDLTAKSEKR